MRWLLLLLVVASSAEAVEKCFPEPSCKRTVPPAAQTIASGGTISADACGTVKKVSAAGSVTTSTTNTFDAPAGDNSGCIMTVCNTGSNTITLDSNTNFPGSGAANVSLTSSDCVVVAQTGTVWFQVSAVLSNN